MIDDTVKISKKDFEKLLKDSILLHEIFVHCDVEKWEGYAWLGYCNALESAEQLWMEQVKQL
jgi:hypothetical protein